MWREYERDQWGPNPRRKRMTKGCPVSTRIPTYMDEEENERESTENECIKIPGWADHNNIKAQRIIIKTKFH